MNLRNKWTMGLLGLGAAALVAISATAVYAQSTTTDQPPAAGQQAPSAQAGPGRGGMGRGEDNSAILAEVLGISQEELQAAVATAREAAITQALADGTITQEQADAMRAQEGGRGLGWGPLGSGADHDAELAEALGITLDELKAAKAEVNQRVVADKVVSGEITQEEADLMAARQALNEYLHDRLENAYKEGVAQAVTDGIITQAQADQILADDGPGFFGPGLGGGHHGGPQGDSSFGGPKGEPGQAPNNSPLQPDSNTQPSGSGA